MDDSTDRPKPTAPRRRPLILADSPIEFALTGPARRGRRLVAQSGTAKLDLIGYANLGLERKYYARPSSIIRLFYRQPGIMSTISHELPDLISGGESDDRLASFELIWRGIATSDSRLRIKEMLSVRAADISAALRASDEDELRWHLAPILFVASETAKRETEKRNVLIGSIGAYTILILLASLFSLIFRTFFK